MKIAPARGSDRSDAVDADNPDHLSVLRKRDFPHRGRVLDDSLQRKSLTTLSFEAAGEA